MDINDSTNNTIVQEQNHTNESIEKNTFIIVVKFDKEEEISNDEYSITVLYVTKELL